MKVNTERIQTCIETSWTKLSYSCTSKTLGFNTAKINHLELGYDRKAWKDR